MDKKMNTRYTPSQNEYRRMTTDELREAFLVDLFEEGKLHWLYCEVERTIIGAAVPTVSPLVLEAGKELASDYFCQRRELGVINVGEGAGTISVDDQPYSIDKLDGLYIGRGSQKIVFDSTNAHQPARFYLISYPAHKEYATTLIKKAEVNAIELGSPEDANQRTIYQYIHEKGVRSCQLVMGVTSLQSGSVWNTMPCHTHERRTEIYFYFGLGDQARIFHMMGPRDETRHIIMDNHQAVISPMWSIHAGCGTQSYSFCWAMGGENQRFDDMDHIKMKDLK